VGRVWGGQRTVAAIEAIDTGMRGGPDPEVVEQSRSCRAMAMPDKNKEKTMPHVIVKLWPGKTEQQKTRLAEAIAKDV
jgi:Tautomerase enzyme